MNPPDTDNNTVLPLIADPAAYRPETIDLIDDGAAREYWLCVFEKHIVGMMKIAVAAQGGTADAPARAAACTAAFLAEFQAIRQNPRRHPELSILKLCDLRRLFIDEHGFHDPYELLKKSENTAAMKLLPALFAELDAMPAAERLQRLVENIFAGNIFDMGSNETAALYHKGGVDFHATRKRLPPRPWLVDCMDDVLARFGAEAPHRKAIVFVDNAGSDVVLGMIPFTRFLLTRGTRIVMTSNSGPALNDILHTELVPLLAEIAAFDPVYRDALSSGQLTPIASGNNLPVMDSRRLSAGLCAEAADADLLVIEGMGRGLETNYRTKFTVDTLKVAMVKEQIVADVLGGRMYDVVCRFERA
jgi:uncharacterized protein with ATP-grasp and redox domains